MIFHYFAKPAKSRLAHGPPVLSSLPGSAWMNPFRSRTEGCDIESAGIAFNFLQAYHLGKIRSTHEHN